jgi:hypothetical protein
MAVAGMVGVVGNLWTKKLAAIEINFFDRRQREHL